MRKTFLLFAALSLLLALPLAAWAQGKTARLVGYEKAGFVTGEIDLSADGSMVKVRNLKSVYKQPLELYLTKGFDYQDSVKIGLIPAGSHGDMSFDAPAPPGDLESMDSVILKVPEWAVPVALGLLR
ncbi:MAG: hypothetical protein GXP52_05020 [Deltaproteobacteria bacterium]|nr:hypothetical protein [Deltaproteobacteria bacterium]